MTGAAAVAVSGMAACALGRVPPDVAAVARAADGADTPQGRLDEDAVAERVLHRISLGSCANQALPQPVWQALLADAPDLHLFGGDNVYASQRPWRVHALRQAYAQLAAEPGFAKLREKVAHLAIWDDHDYGLNDGGADFAHQAESRAEFFDFWRVPALDSRRSRQAIYHARLFGRPGQCVQVLMLDTRAQRSPWQPTDQRGAQGKERYVPSADTSRTLLGAAQWQWLRARLARPADLRLVVSGIQVIAEGHGFEHWGLFPHEQQRLLDSISDSAASGVLLLSGDRHLGAVYRRERGAPYPITELTSSGLTHAWESANEPGPNRLGALVRVPHYALIDIDWAQRQLSLIFKDVQGRTLQQHTLSLNSLQARRS